MKRIKTIASLIHPCQCVYDVGSDHAFLSILILKMLFQESELEVLTLENIKIS